MIGVCRGAHRLLGVPSVRRQFASLGLPSRLRIRDVSPRDGLQTEKKLVPVEIKRGLVERLWEAGLEEVEVAAFVSPQWVPQMETSIELVRTLTNEAPLPLNKMCSCLVPNLKGLHMALELGVRDVALVVASTDAFSRANLNTSLEDGLTRVEEMADYAHRHGMYIKGYVSGVFSCPIDKTTVPVSRITSIAQRLDRCV
jgi:isopropylmalate/homocitrate/citramalate synthase